MPDTTMKTWFICSIGVKLEGYCATQDPSLYETVAFTIAYKQRAKGNVRIAQVLENTRGRRHKE